MIQEKLAKTSIAYEILHELYQTIDDAFLAFFISLAAVSAWRPHLGKYEEGYRRALQDDGVEEAEIERRLAEQDHIFSIEEFQIQVNTKKVRNALVPGVFENLQAKNTIKIVYDSWETSYRPRLEKLIGKKIQSDIWGDLGWLRQSIAHRNSRGIDKLINAKLIKNFKPGEELVFTIEIMARIAQELEKWYTEFLMKYFSQDKV